MNYGDQIKEVATGNTSAAVLALAGAVAPYRAFSALAIGAARVPVDVRDASGNWLVGRYTRTGANTLTRTAIETSSNNNADVVFDGGVLTVSNVPTAGQMAEGLVDPDDIGLNILFLAGQSNVVSRADLDAVLDIGDPRVFQFGCTVGQARYQTIFPATEPMHWTDGLNAGKMSGALWMARTYMRGLPGNRMCLLVPVAVGSTNLVAGAAEWAVGGTLYNNLISKVNAALAAAVAQYPNSRVVGGKILLGENDTVATPPTSKDAFVAGMKAMIAGIRAGVTGAADSWLIIGGMAPGFISGHGADGAAINEAHIQVAAETDRCVFVPGRAGYDDGTHYNAAGQRFLGVDAGLAIPAAMRSRVVDTTAPVEVQAVVSNATPTFVDVTFSEGLDSSHVAPASAYAVSDHVVSAAAAPVGSTVRLTVTAAFVNGEARTLAYTPPGGANNLRDSAGNLMLAFSAKSITNNVGVAATAPAQMVAPVATVTGATTVGIALTAPSDGGSAITGYTVVSSPAGMVDSAAGTTSLSRSMTGGTTGQAYAFTAVATNAVGSSPASPESNSVTPAAAAAATWNPSDKAAGIVLSNGNKTATAPAGASANWNVVRSTTSKTTGKLYFEVTLDANTAVIGIATSGLATNNIVGFEPNGWGYYSVNGSHFHASGSNPLGGSFPAFVAPDVIGCAVDLTSETKTLQWYKGGVAVGFLYEIAADTYFAALSVRENGAPTSAATINCGPTFVYAPPAGHEGGWA